MKQTTIILSALILMSCSARKVSKEQTKETVNTEVKSTTEVRTDKQSTTKILDTSSIDEIEIVPIDNTKPIVVNGVSYANAKIKHYQRKNNITTDKVEKVSKNERNEVVATKKQIVEASKKQTQRTSFNLWWLLLLLIPIFWYVWKRLSFLFLTND